MVRINAIKNYYWLWSTITLLKQEIAIVFENDRKDHEILRPVSSGKGIFDFSEAR